MLQFALGLETAGFLGPLGVVGRYLHAFTGGLLSVGGIAHGVFEALERGGKLADMSARTGADVKSLYQLGEAYKVAGLSSETAVQHVLKLQKALGGTDEMGNKLGDVFQRLGLSVAQLSRLDAAGRMQALLAAVSRMPRDEAANTLSKIFGRFGFGDILQLTNQLGDFNATLKETAKEGAIVARSAFAFDELGDAWERIKSRFRLLFTGLAEGLVPLLGSIVEKLKGIEFTKMANQIARFVGGIGMAIKEGQFSELIRLSFAAGMEQCMQIFSKAIVAMAQFLADTLGNADLWKGIWSVGIGSLGKSPLGKAMVYAMAPFLQEKGETPRQTVARLMANQQAGSDSLVTKGMKDLAAGTPAALDSFRKAWETLSSVQQGPASKAFGAKMEEWSGKAAAALAKMFSGGGGGGAGELEKRIKPRGDDNPLAKIGFFSGSLLGAPDTTYASKTAENTGKTVTVMMSLKQSIDNGFKLTNGFTWANK